MVTGKGTLDVSFVPYSTSKGIFCKFIHVNIELLLSHEKAPWYMFITMSEDMDKIYRHGKFANNCLFMQRKMVDACMRR